jgi:hypothetical protein
LAGKLQTVAHNAAHKFTIGNFTMRFKALVKGDIMLATDYVANENTLEQVGEGGLSIGLPWNKTAYHPMYRKISEAVEPAAQSGEAPVQQLRAEILPIAAQALVHCKNYNRELAIDLLNKLTAKLSSV